MYRTVIEEWVENILIPNLLKDKKLVTVINKAKYHSTYFEKKDANHKYQKDTTVASTLKHIIGNSNPIPGKPVLLINNIMTEKTGYSVSHLLPCHCAECDRKDKKPSKTSCVTLEFVDKSALELCRFNGKLCKEIRDLDKLHKPCNNRRKTI